MRAVDIALLSAAWSLRLSFPAFSCLSWCWAAP